MKYGFDAKGTNAHELPTTITALAAKNGSDEDIRNAPYKVLEQWQEIYGGN